MTLAPLTIVPAGAGSGKTHTIQQRLGEWIVDGKIAPERIVAVTFTEAAAAELRERIRAKLLGLGRLEDALELDRAYVSTIHGFGLRLLTEFAFDAGLSPRPRALNDDEENTLIRLALARTDKADVVTARLTEYGYRYDFPSQRSAEEVFRDDLLNVVTQLRSAGWTHQSDAYAQGAVRWIRERYGAAGDGAASTAKLQRAAKSLLDAFPENLAAPCGKNATAKKDLQRDYRNLRAALAEAPLSSDWQLWQQLRELRPSKRGTPLPAGYDDLADAVRRAADALPTHPGPLRQATSLIEALLAAGQDVLVHYARAKREAGLVDYADMIAMAAAMLRDRPEVLQTLVARMDCMVVDEFQDTNPLQFALLWQLKTAGVPTVVVGDMKQAIMGFQGADPRLFNALIQQHPTAARPLERNWRSQPRLMHFVNAVGAGLFKDYAPLEPCADESVLAPIELIEFPAKAKKSQHAVRAAAVGQRLGELLADPKQQVRDRRTRQPRRLRGGDIAVLCPTHQMLSDYAVALRGQGLRVRLQETGWHASRIVQLALQALAYVANPADRHAALYLAVTELGSLDLEAACQQLVDPGRLDEPLLARLDGLAGQLVDRTVYGLVADTLSALGLFDVVARWPDADQARANLLRLQAEAGEFMEANREALASGGFHGSGIQSFLAWLDTQVERKDRDNQPDSRSMDEDAVQLVTWHGAKGREWPVVFVAGMDRKLSPRLSGMALGYASFDDLAQLLATAQIEYAPKFAAPEASERFLQGLQDELAVEARRLIYVAMTRARDKLVLEWPSYLAVQSAKDRAEKKEKLTYWSILANDAGVARDADSISAGGATFPCIVTQGGSALPDADDALGATPAAALSTTGRRAIRRASVPETLTPDSVAPSATAMAAANAPTSRPTLRRYHDGLELDLDLSATAQGTFLHRCFELLGAKPALADRLSAITGVALDEDELGKIADSVARFEAWQAEYFSAKSVLRELPLLALEANGSVVSGTADLVLELDDGVWVIDHKSDPVDDPETAFRHYRPQLECYAALLGRMGHPVAGVGINWIRRGEVSLAAGLRQANPAAR